jgi:DNA-binding response OmpR family regulator
MPKVLLVEDDPMTVALLKTFLEIEGFQTVIPANGGSDVIVETIRTEQPELLLLDVHLREINGMELLTHLRADRHYDRMGIFVVSGTEVGEQCLRAGADGFLLKPYAPSDLLHLMRAYLEKKTGQQPQKAPTRPLEQTH